MHAKELLEYRNKIIDTFKDGTFRSEHLKESDAAAYDYVLKNLNNSTEKIKSMEEKINLSFKSFLDIQQLIMQKSLLTLKIEIKTKKLQKKQNAKYQI